MKSERQLQQTHNELCSLKAIRDLAPAGIVTLPITVTIEGRKVKMKTWEEVDEVLAVYDDIIPPLKQLWKVVQRNLWVSYMMGSLVQKKDGIHSDFTDLAAAHLGKKLRASLMERFSETPRVLSFLRSRNTSVRGTRVTEQGSEVADPSPKVGSEFGASNTPSEPEEN